jgi:hypothetical protein
MNGSGTPGRKNRRLMKSVDRKAYEERVIKTYRVFHSVRKVAALVGTNKDAVSVILRQHKIDTKAPVKVRPPSTPRQANGRIATWLKAHGNRKLPRDYKNLAEVIGVSHGALRTFFYRRRLAVRKVIKSLPELKALHGVTLVSLEGRIFGVDEIAAYTYVLDKFTLEVHISAKLTTGEHLLCPVTDLKAFAQALKAYAGKETK